MRAANYSTVQVKTVFNLSWCGIHQIIIFVTKNLARRLVNGTLDIPVVPIYPSTGAIDLLSHSLKKTS
jgi:hypothetical protein